MDIHGYVFKVTQYEYRCIKSEKRKFKQDTSYTKYWIPHYICRVVLVLALYTEIYFMCRIPCMSVAESGKVGP